MSDITLDDSWDDEEVGLSSIGDVLDEKDPFRLVIRGFALIDGLLDEAISNAFGDRIPRELSGLRLPARLALAGALQVLPPDVSAAVRRLGKVNGELFRPEEVYAAIMEAR